jgi:hypothetical protein
MFEKRFASVPAQAFTANGTANGIITIIDTTLFKVKQKVYLSAPTLPHLDNIEVKHVIDSTHLVVGPTSGNIKSTYDVSAYTVALGASIGANEQKRPEINLDDHSRAVYEEEPTVAVRVMPVDKLGNSYTATNPMPVAGNISVSAISYRKTEISYDTNGNPIDVKKYTGTLASPVLAEEKVIAYDSNDNPISVTKVFP